MSREGGRRKKRRGEGQGGEEVDKEDLWNLSFLSGTGERLKKVLADHMAHYCVGQPDENCGHYNEGKDVCIGSQSSRNLQS